MKTDLGIRKFAFAVISDTHVNPDGDNCNSPFPVNARANRRFRHLVADLNQRDIDFVIHLGDLVHPVPATGTLYAQAAKAYKKIVAGLKIPIHHVPGNHDIGDTPLHGAPSEPVDPHSIAAWDQNFGPQYSTFSHEGVRYVLLNAQLINSGLPDEVTQRNWVEAELAGSHERIFLMLHHPAYICATDEPSHYDNTDPPGRDWLLGLLTAHNVEAMFCGHAHNFWYDRFGETDYYVVPSPSFVRQDYSEMARSSPPEGSEMGRDDRAKLGYFIVTVYENTHCVQIIRTQGAELLDGEIGKKFPSLGSTPRENPNPVIGFDMRRNWAEFTEIPPSGGLDEFDRKIARNDYPLLALIEMGVRDIRVPLSDLRDRWRRQRLRHLHHLGFRPTLFGFGIPCVKDMKIILGVSDILHHYEMTIDWADFAQLLPKIKIMEAHTGLCIFLSRLRTKSDLRAGSSYFHVINHGFSTEDADQLRLLSHAKIAGAIFRLGLFEPAVKTLQEIDEVTLASGLDASVHLRMAGENPAIAHVDENGSIARLREVMGFAAKNRRLHIFCDGFADVDRGYFAKLGAIDCHDNPTALAHAVSGQHGSVP